MSNCTWWLGRSGSQCKMSGCGPGGLGPRGKMSGCGPGGLGPNRAEDLVFSNSGAVPGI